jgi:hypothetical protein
VDKRITDYELDAMLKNYCARRTQQAFDAPVKEKAMFKRKGFKYAVTALALVAVLSAGILSGIMLNKRSAEKESKGFFVTACAAESSADETVAINDKEFTPIGRIKPEMIIEGFYGRDAKGKAPNIVGSLLDISFRCEDKDIKKLTYKIQGADFFLDKGQSKVFGLNESKADCILPIRQDDSTFWHIASPELLEDDSSVKKCYSEFSFDYSVRDKIFKADKSRFAPIEILASCRNKTKRDMPQKQLYENMINNIVVSITATYNDAVTETKRVRLHCIYNGDLDITVTAKIE